MSKCKTKIRQNYLHDQFIPGIELLQLDNVELIHFEDSNNDESFLFPLFPPSETENANISTLLPFFYRYKVNIFRGLRKIFGGPGKREERVGESYY